MLGRLLLTGALGGALVGLLAGLVVALSANGWQTCGAGIPVVATAVLAAATRDWCPAPRGGAARRLTSPWSTVLHTC